MSCAHRNQSSQSERCLARCGLATAAVALFLAMAPPDVSGQERINLPATDRPLDGNPEGIFSVGELDGEDWEVFSKVTAVDFDPAGNLYVLDEENFRVFVYGETGELLRQFGSEGEGPGELTDPIGMTVLADGRIAVKDGRKQSIILYHADGSYDQNIPYEGLYGQEFQGLISHPERGVLYEAPQVSFESGPDGLTSEVGDAVPVLWHPLDGQNPKVLTRAPLEKPTVEIRDGGANSNMQFGLTTHTVFNPTVRWTVNSSGALVLASTAAYEIQILGPDGQSHYTLSRDISPRQTGDADRDQHVEEIRRSYAESVGAGQAVSMGGGALPSGLPDAVLQRMKETTPFAEEIPVIRKVTSDQRGQIWVERETNPVGVGTGQIDLISDGRQYLGSITDQPLPDAFGPDGLVAYIEFDEQWEFPRVAVKRLPESWR